MPEIVIQYKDGMGVKEVWRKLVTMLREQCAERFSVPQHKVSPRDFGVVDHPLVGASDPTHHVIIRILLHHFEERVRTGDVHAAALAKMASDVLNSDELVAYRGRVTVGVSLAFAEIAWAAR